MKLVRALTASAALMAAALLAPLLPPSAVAQSVAAPAVAAPGIQLFSPLDYQVFQRQTRLRGTIAIRGRATLPSAAIEVRLSGQSFSGPLPAEWRKLAFDARTGDFQASLAMTSGGFYAAEVRVQRDGESDETLTVPHVGVGEVFVVSGQSNSTNYREVRQVTETGVVTTFSGTAWRLANDPQPGVQDNSTKGSFIPAFGDALYRRYRVPIGIASVGHGSTSVRQWLPADDPLEVMPTMPRYVRRAVDGTLISDGTLFNGMAARID